MQESELTSGGAKVNGVATQAVAASPSAQLRRISPMPGLYNRIVMTVSESIPDFHFEWFALCTFVWFGAIIATFRPLEGFLHMVTHYCKFTVSVSKRGSHQLPRYVQRWVLSYRHAHPPLQDSSGDSYLFILLVCGTNNIL